MSTLFFVPFLSRARTFLLFAILFLVLGRSSLSCVPAIYLFCRLLLTIPSFVLRRSMQRLRSSSKWKRSVSYSVTIYSLISFQKILSTTQLRPRRRRNPKRFIFKTRDVKYDFFVRRDPPKGRKGKRRAAPKSRRRKNPRTKHSLQLRQSRKIQCHLLVLSEKFWNIAYLQIRSLNQEDVRSRGGFIKTWTLVNSNSERFKEEKLSLKQINA